MHSAVDRQGHSPARPRPAAHSAPAARCASPKSTVACGIALSLVAACAGCRNDAPAPVGRQAAGVPVAAPVKAADPQPEKMDLGASVTAADPQPDEKNLRKTDPDGINPAAVQSDAPNPLGGCVICHIDAEDELKGSAHYAEDVGCIACHGPSEGHAADENNEVKPDELFATEDVERLCGECHKCSRLMAGAPPQRKVCTECHHPHGLVVPAKAEAE